jgi:hypothetical protein
MSWGLRIYMRHTHHFTEDFVHDFRLSLYLSHPADVPGSSSNTRNGPRRGIARPSKLVKP